MSARYRWHLSPGSDGLWHRLHPAMGPDDLLPRADVLSLEPLPDDWWACRLHAPKDPLPAGTRVTFRRLTLERAKFAAVELAIVTGILSSDDIVEEAS